MKQFLIGAATAAHQVEGNNIYSDFWKQEQMVHSNFKEPSLDAVDHYHRFKEDIDLMVNAKMNAYRFSIEWSRIEPEKGKFDQQEINHYREVLKYCIENNIQPIVTLHHFSSPAWLIQEGGWASEMVVDYFNRYAMYVVDELHEYLEYICTINEANMGLQIHKKISKMMQDNGVDLQVGINLSSLVSQEVKEENLQVFHSENPVTFLSPRDEKSDEIVMQTHCKCRESIKKKYPNLQVGLTLSLHDFQVIDGGEKLADKEWDVEFKHYVPYIKNDDFIGVQNYTRNIVSKDGIIKPNEDARLTTSGYEFYPQALGNVIRKVSKALSIPILVTENGISTNDDTERIEFIKEVLVGVKECINEGIVVLGYLHWSLLDNFEWNRGYEMRFGLIDVDRNTQTRKPKPSLKYVVERCSALHLGDK